jgi:magnesium transporter
VRHRRRPGASPGLIQSSPDSPQPVLTLIAYDRERLVEKRLERLDEIPDILTEFPVVWLDVSGLGDAETIREVGRIFDLHALALEDVTSHRQRAKVEDYGDRTFLVAAMVSGGPSFSTEQLCLFAGPGFVVTFQERTGDSFDPVRERIRKETGRIRRSPPGYLAYALLDALVDHYFPVVESFGTRLDDLEEEIVTNPTPECLAAIRQAKRESVEIRREVWALRETLNRLFRDEFRGFPEEVDVFLRDCYDHTVRLLDLAETQREIVGGLLDAYMTNVSHRMNQVMQVLTIMASIFIPLTFIAGVYGMNFESMPELKWPWAYPVALGVMAAVGIGMLVWFRRLGWLGGGGTKGLILILLLPVAIGCATAPEPRPDLPPTVATFSIVARDPLTGDLGVAVQSKFLGVGSVVPWAKADVGAIATQAFANTTFGPRGIAMLQAGKNPDEVLEALTGADTGHSHRQVGIVDGQGRAASFTGKKTLKWSGHVVGEGFACQGNILAGEAVVKAMAKAFTESKEPFPERLVAALAGGQAAGGDSRGRQSAAILVVRKMGGYAGFNDRYIDLRVEDHERPIEELGRILALHRKTFGIPPLPGELAGFKLEDEPLAEGLATPRSVWAAWVKRFRAKDFEGLHALYTKEWREANPFAPWKESVVENLAGYQSFVDRAKYAGTKYEGNRARIALRLPGSPRPYVIPLLRVDGEWRFNE